MELEPKDKIKVHAVSFVEASHTAEITAPSNLPAGYVLPVDIGGEVCNVIVPEGGVTQGQTFNAQYTPKASEKKYSPEIPVGHWRDGLCDCCMYGCCHPMLCNAYCFPIVAISQVMTRLNLNPCAFHGSATYTFKVAVLITVSYVIFNFTVNIIITAQGYGPDETLPPGIFWPVCIVSNVVWVYFMVVVIKTRIRIRDRYHIPTVCCGGLEDCCCAICCPCCVVSQMGRHTTNYRTERAYCCTSTGLSPNPPCLDVMEKQPPKDI